MSKAKKAVRDEAEEANKGPVKRFFGTVGDHFMTLVGANFLYAVFNIPMMLLAFVFVMFFLPLANPVFVPENFQAFMSDAGIVSADGTDGIEQLYFMIMALCSMILMGTGLICIGPFQVGFSQVYRNIYRGKEVSLWHDFVEGMKKNWKQGLAASLISLPVTAILLFGAAYYSSGESTVGTVISTLFVVGFFLFVAMQNFVYQQIVSIDLPVSKLYKNALLFCLLKLGPVIAMTGVLVVALMIVPFALLISTTMFGYSMAVIWYLAIVIWLCQYMYAFATGDFINQYVAPGKPAASEAAEGSDEEKSADEASGDEDDESEEGSDEDSEDDDESEDNGDDEDEGSAEETSDDDGTSNEASEDSETENTTDTGDSDK